MPTEPPARQSGGTLFGTSRADHGDSDQSRGGTESDRLASDVRPPAPRAAADDEAMNLPLDAPAEIAIGTARVAASAGMAESAEANAPAGTTKVTADGDHSVGVAPAPRAPADDIIEPELGRPYVMLGKSTPADRAPSPSGIAATGADASKAEPAGADHADADAGNSAAAVDETGEPADGDLIASAESDPVEKQDAGGQQTAATSVAVATPTETDAVAGRKNPDDNDPEHNDTDQTRGDADHGHADADHDDPARADDNDPNHIDTDHRDAVAHSTDLDDGGAGEETNPLGGSDGRPDTAPSDEDAGIASPTAESEVAATDATVDGDPDPAIAEPAAAVPAESEDDHDAAATGAAPGEPGGGRP